MITKEQSERSEEAFRTVVTKQLPAFTNQLLENLLKILKLGEKWPTKLLLFTGTILLVASLAMKIDYPFKIASLSDVEFTALIFASSGLLIVGALLSLFHAWGWRRLLQAQQTFGIEVLTKQIDVEKELLTGKHRYQEGQLFLLPAKIHKRYRR